MGLAVSERVKPVVESKQDSRPCPLMFSSICNRLRNRPDSEHEMTFNRIILVSFVFAYTAMISYLDWDHGDDIVGAFAIVGIIHLTLAAAIFAHILWKPAECIPRRILAMIADLTSTTAAIHFGGVWCLWLYPFLLWIVFGNGFRFGVKYLFVASAISVVGFSLLMIFSPFWHRYPALSWGCLVGLIALPAYVSILIRKLSDSIELAEQANRAKSLFLASVSHELRTPLNAIIGLSDLMKSTKLNAEQSDMSQTIGDAGRTLLSLINSVLDLSRLEVGKMPFTMERVDLFALLNRIHRITRVMAEGKGLQTDLQIAADVPRFISASSRQLEEIITNLMSNAIKFTERGHVFVRVRAENIDGANASLAFEITDTGIGLAESALTNIFERFMQADETIVNRFGGTGLGLAIVKQMVEQGGGTISVDSTLGKGSTFTVRMSFEMLEDSVRDNAETNTIAVLSQDANIIARLRETCDNLIELPSVVQAQTLLNDMQSSGKIKPILYVDLECPGNMLAMADIISGKKDKRTPAHLVAILDESGEPLDGNLARYFASFVERSASSQTIANATTIALCKTEGASTIGSDDIFLNRKKGSILVADDNKTNQKVIGKILERAGHAVTFADNGQIAVEQLLNIDFDIAFMDINMPVVNGIEAMKLYRVASIGRKQTPVFALTADVTEATQAKCIESGMIGTLSKPIEPAQLLSVIDAHVLETVGPIAVSTGQASVNEPDRAEDLEASPAGPIDTLALSDLAELGGSDFVREVVDQFADDAVGILEGLAKAVETQDYRAFRDELHALRSGAANVGARDVFQFCLKWREIAPEELSTNGEEHLFKLRNQLDEARQLLKSHIDNGSFGKETAGREKLYG